MTKRLAVLVPLAATVLLALLSNGSYQDDDLMHYLMARWSWTHPQYLADDWGRPGFTVPYALVANIGSPAVGFMLARMMTVAIVAGVAWLTLQVAREVVDRKWAWLAPAALVLMPLYFRMSYTTLTETVGSLYVALGTWLLLKDKSKLAAIAFSLVPLTRHEGIALLPAIALLLAWRRSFTAIPLLFTGEIAWNIAKPVLGFPLHELPIMRFLVRDAQENLGSGGPLHYLMCWAEAAGPAQLAVGAVGIAVLSNEAWRRFRRSRAYDVRTAILIVNGVGTAVMIVLQTLLYMVNTHESGGYARFLLPIASWMAICSAAGASWLMKQTARQPLMLAGIAMTAIVGLATIEGMRHGFNGWWGWPLWYGWLLPVSVACAVFALRPSVHRRRLFLRFVIFSVVVGWLACLWPYRLRPHQRLVGEVIAAIESDPNHAAQRVIADNPWSLYFANRPFTLKQASAPNWWRYNPEGGLIYVWDIDHSANNLPMDELRSFPHRMLPMPAVKTLTSAPQTSRLHNYLVIYERLPDRQTERE